MRVALENGKKKLQHENQLKRLEDLESRINLNKTMVKKDLLN